MRHAALAHEVRVIGRRRQRLIPDCTRPPCSFGVALGLGALRLGACGSSASLGVERARSRARLALALEPRARAPMAVRDRALGPLRHGQRLVLRLRTLRTRLPRRAVPVDRGGRHGAPSAAGLRRCLIWYGDNRCSATTRTPAFGSPVFLSSQPCTPARPESATSSPFFNRANCSAAPLNAMTFAKPGSVAVLGERDLGDGEGLAARAGLLDRVGADDPATQQHRQHDALQAGVACAGAFLSSWW